jgi:phage shock protein C
MKPSDRRRAGALGEMTRLECPERDEMTCRNPLVRSWRDVKIAGVCGGIADWLGWDPTHVRVFYVVLTVFSAAFPGVLLYLALWYMMPQDPQRPLPPL